MQENQTQKPIKRKKGFTIEISVMNDAIGALLTKSTELTSDGIYANSRHDQTEYQIKYRELLLDVESEYRRFFSVFASEKFQKKMGSELTPEQLHSFTVKHYVSYGYFEIEGCYTGEEFATTIKIKILPADGLTNHMRDMLYIKRGLNTEKLKASLLLEKSSKAFH